MSSSPSVAGGCATSTAAPPDLLESSSEKRIKRTTQMAFACKDKEAEFELAGRVTILRLLPGVGIGVASAILALCYPKRYAPLDARVWSALFDEQRSTFELADYRRYLMRLSELAAEVKGARPQGRLVGAARRLLRRRRRRAALRLSP